MSKMCIVIFTVFDTSREWRNEFLYQAKQLAIKFNWDLKKYTYGIHRNAKREHQHITCIYDCSGAKTWKILSDKIKRSSDWWKQSDIIYKITTQYRDGSAPCETTIPYDEIRAMQYNFKEYDTDEQMWGDLMTHGDDAEKMFLGVTKAEAETMRHEANKIYRIKRAKFEKDLKDKAEQENTKVKMYEFIKQTECFDPQSGIVNNITRVIVAILKFHKQEDRHFRINCLKDTAINFLFKEGFCTELDIVEYLHI